jgi:hypothetical protein
MGLRLPRLRYASRRHLLRYRRASFGVPEVPFAGSSRTGLKTDSQVAIMCAVIRALVTEATVVIGVPYACNSSH